MIDLSAAPQQFDFNFTSEIFNEAIEVIEKFRQAMSNAGIATTSEVVADGTIHRFMVEGDKAGSKNGWYILHSDSLPAGSFGCHKRGIDENWSFKDFTTLTQDERIHFDARMKESKRIRDADLARVQAECRAWCEDIFKKAVEAPANHPYLVKKGVQAYGLKLLIGNLMVPLRDVSGITHGIQFILPDGNKKFKTGTAKQGHYFPIGKSITSNTLLVCEGYATGASLHESTGHAVAVAFDAGDLLSVAKNLRKKFPEMNLVICADNDESDIGQEKAKEAALAIGGVVVMPPDVGDDFNDLHQKKGIEAVEDCFEAARERGRHGVKGANGAKTSGNTGESDRLNQGYSRLKKDKSREKALLQHAREVFAPTEGATPDYPFAALGPLAEACNVIAEHGQVSHAMAGQCLLTTSALLAQSVADVRTLAGVKPLSLYGLTVAESGNGKSTAEKAGLQPVHDRQSETGEPTGKL